MPLDALAAQLAGHCSCFGGRHDGLTQKAMIDEANVVERTLCRMR